MKRYAGLVAVWLCGALGVATAQETGQRRGTAPENASILAEDMKVDLQFLASDSTRGRVTGTPENRIAAEYIKARFQKIGLKPAGPGGSYYQPFNQVSSTLGTDNQIDVAIGDGATLRRKIGQDFYPQKFSTSGRARGSVAFVGFGVKPGDYETVSQGSIVLVLDHEPGEFDANSPLDGLVSSEASTFLRKVLLAQSKGAVGVLFVEDVHNHPGQRNFEATAKATWPPQPPKPERLTLAEWADQVRIPAAQISPALAEVLVRGTKRSLSDLAKSAETMGSAILLPGVQVDLTTSVDRHVVVGYNVLGMIEGSDPKLKDECVILSGHHDHLGTDDAGVPLNGADDNLSGVVAVIDQAEAYAQAAKAGQRPARSVIFVSFDAEEKGLLGAWAYTEHPALPLEKTVAVLNMDLIGRSEEAVADPRDGRFRGLTPQTADQNRDSINVLGETRFPWLKAQVDEANRPFGLQVKRVLDNNASQLLRRSDHWPFLQRGVPAVWFLTGLHRDYHTIYDREERIEYDKLQRVARMVHQMSWNLLQQGKGVTGAATVRD
jgi:hypothetical protein